jgi:hydrogenase-4 component B
MEKILLIMLPLFPMAGALAILIPARKNPKACTYAAVAVCAAELVMTALLWRHADAALSVRIGGIAEFGLNLTVGSFRYIYLALTSFGWFLAALFGIEYFAHARHLPRYHFFSLLTLGATMGVFASADLITTFIFIEIMSFSAYVLIVHDEGKKTVEAANVYLGISVLSGLVLIFGIFILYNALGTADIASLYAAAQAYANKKVLYLACGLMLFGFATKAGTFPMHVWLPKAHPAAPAPASALFSGIMIKTGFFGMLVIACEILRNDALWGNILLAFGLATMLIGAFFALLSIDLKRILAFSSVSQSGFITTGIAMQCLLASHGGLAAYGTALHMVNHTLVKLCLFMLAGAVYSKTHALNLNQIRGFGRNKPYLMVVFAAASLSLMGMAGTAGYISKTLLHEAIVEQIAYAAYGMQWYYTTAEYVFILTGGLTAAYLLKVFVAVFVDRPPAERAQAYTERRCMSFVSAAAVTLPAALLIVFGIFPHGTFEKVAESALSFMHAHAPAHLPHYLDFACLRGALLSAAIGAAVYFVFIRPVLIRAKGTKEKRYVQGIPEWSDMEREFYRPLVMKVIPALLAVFCRFFDRLADMIAALAMMAYGFLKDEVYLTASKREGDDDPAVGENAVLDTVSSSLLLFSVGLLAVLLYIVLG